MISQDTWLLLFYGDLVLLGCVAVYAYYHYYKRLTELKEIQIDAYKKAAIIINEANLKSNQILEKIEQKADEILTHSQLFKNDLNQEFKETVKKLAESYLEMVQSHSNKFIADYENILTSVKNQSISKSGQALDNIGYEVKKQLEEAKAVVKTEMMKSLSKAIEELNQYKRKELEKVDQEIDVLVVQLAKDLLRMNISPKDHHKLVIQALEKAKEQGMFFL